MKSQRHISVIQAAPTSKDPKITYRPATEEFTVKLPSDISIGRHRKVIELVNTIAESLPDDVAMTLRGTARWNDDLATYAVTLRAKNSPLVFRFYHFALRPGISSIPR